MPIPVSGILKSRGARGALLAVLAIEALVVAGVYHSERARLKAEQDLIGFGDASRLGRDWWKVEGPGLGPPPTHSAAGAGLADDEEVIGLVVDGRARAYRLGAFDDPSRHIVNDLIGDRPVTVAYCDLSDCARAYAGPVGGRPLDISQAGLQGGVMIVKAGGAYYRHRSGEPMQPGAPAFPHASHPLVRRRWGDWRREHPGTDLYLGPSRRPSP